MQQHDLDWDRWAREWVAPYVPRSEIARFTEGLLSPGTMANLDCDGKGPEGAFYIGRKLVYPIENLIRWIRARSSDAKPPTVRKK